MGAHEEILLSELTVTLRIKEARPSIEPWRVTYLGQYTTVGIHKTVSGGLPSIFDDEYTAKFSIQLNIIKPLEYIQIIQQLVRGMPTLRVNHGLAAALHQINLFI